ncbi:MAG: class I SAM-dependent methyltransferase [Candidatus Krumholzibacteriia bacterium]
MSRHAVDRYYDGISGEYDRERFGTPYMRAVAEAEERRVAAWLAPRQERLLEVGPGTGRFTRHLAGLADDLQVCDISQKMLDTVRQRLGEQPQVTYRLLGIEELPGLPDYGRFDAAVAMRIVPHVPDWRSALTTLCDAVRPGGLVIFDLWNRDSYVGLTRRLLRRRAEVLTHRLSRVEIRAALAALPVDPVASYRWGYPRLGRFSLDVPGARLCPDWAYSIVTCARRRA